jgi:hypothetical protein
MFQQGRKILPFSISRSIEIKEFFMESDTDALYMLIESLKRQKARNIQHSGHNITFRGGIFRFVSSWNQLGAISSGSLTLKKTESSLIVNYKIKFTEMLIIVTAMVIGFLGPPVWNASNTGIVESIIILSFAWFWLFGGNVAITYFRFPRFLKNSLVEE